MYMTQEGPRSPSRQQNSEQNNTSTVKEIRQGGVDLGWSNQQMTPSRDLSGERPGIHSQENGALLVRLEEKQS
jgi:hypothetical protein